jgi:hypothetical protein
MSSPNPLQLLEATLNEHEVSLQKSINLYKQGLIDAGIHLIHRENLTKLITNYTDAIKILKRAEQIEFDVANLGIGEIKNINHNGTEK